ncbi:MAG: ABC transporter permease subunit [Conexibacteraceae bacterium]|nr:ABC transporter permease subunit [Conexibacteraceae bacterium]
MLPFLIFVAAFLGGPLYVVVHGAFTTESNQLTLSNFQQVFSQPQYTQALKNSLILALWTAAGPALFGLWFAAAVVSGNPRGLLRRVVSSASGVLAYFAGLPLAFVWIATIGPLGVVTVLLKDLFGFNLTDHFSFSSIAGVGLAYFYFQIPLMIIFISPAIEGLRPEWDEAARNLGASRLQYLRLVVFPVLAPSVIGATLMLFGSAFSAFATALALDGGTLVIVPGRINLALSNNVLPGQDRIAMALGAEMIGVVLIVMIGYWLVQRRAGRWLVK